MAFANPLNWPTGWTRTRYPGYPQFKASAQTTLNDLENVLDALECKNVVITTNQETRLDGGLRTAQGSIPTDTGIALYFSRKGKQLCIPCDKFNTVYGNLRAIGLTLEYIKRMERYGTSQMVEAAFSGFKAIPAETSAIVTPYNRNWWEVLQVSETADWEVVEAAYKRLLHKTHPDTGGSTAEFMALQQAYKEAKESRQ